MFNLCTAFPTPNLSLSFSSKRRMSSTVLLLSIAKSYCSDILASISNFSRRLIPLVSIADIKALSAQHRDKSRSAGIDPGRSGFERCCVAVSFAKAFGLSLLRSNRIKALRAQKMSLAVSSQTPIDEATRSTSSHGLHSLVRLRVYAGASGDIKQLTIQTNKFKASQTPTISN